MTRQYEVVYIFDSALEEAAINERLARFNALIQQPGIEPPQVNHWGKRTLAYPVKKHETGYYVVVQVRRRCHCPARVRAGDQARRRSAPVPRGSQRGGPAGAGDRRQE